VIKYLFSSHGESFEKLPRLLVAIKESNLEIVVDWTHKENLNSIVVFWSFRPCIENFKYYRPFISVDKTHLYK
jgi:hypothetical protein